MPEAIHDAETSVWRVCQQSCEILAHAHAAVGDDSDSSQTRGPTTCGCFEMHFRSFTSCTTPSIFRGHHVLEEAHISLAAQQQQSQYASGEYDEGLQRGGMRAAGLANSHPTALRRRPPLRFILSSSLHLSQLHAHRPWPLPPLLLSEMAVAAADHAVWLRWLRFAPSNGSPVGVCWSNGSSDRQFACAAIRKLDGRKPIQCNAYRKK